MKKSDAGLSEYTEENFSEKQSVENIAESNLDGQCILKRMESDRTDMKTITCEQPNAAINELCSDQNKLG